MINKNAMMDLIKDDTGIPKSTISPVLDSLFDNIVKCVAKDEVVSFVNFGKFSARHRDACAGTNPQTGETITIEAHTVPRFNASDAFRNAVR